MIPPLIDSIEDEAEREKAEKFLLSFLSSLEREAQLPKEQRFPVWESNLDLLEGKHWNLSAPRPSGLSQVTINNIWRIVRQEAALLTDARPTVKVVARSPSLSDAAETLNKLVQAVFFKEHIDLLIVRAVFDLAVFGTAFWKVIWDPKARGGLGDIRILRVDPRSVLQDDVYRLEDAQYIGQIIDLPLADVRRAFPGRGELVKPSTQLTSYSSNLYGTSKIRGSRSVMLEQTTFARASIREWWIQDPSLEGDTLRYPNGRILTCADNVILQDRPSPFILEWPGPWVKMALPSPQDTAWPVTSIEHLAEMQKYLNLAMSNILDQVRFVSQGIWIADVSALTPESRRKLMSPVPPATLIEKNPSGDLRWERLGDISPTSLELVRMLSQLLEFVYGMMDVSYGRVPRGVTAGAALEMLQFASQSIVRLNAREIERGLMDLGQKVLGLILQYYEEDRVEALLGPGGELTRIEFKRAELLGDAPPEELYYQFKFMVRPDSSLALAREKEYAAAMALYGAGLIDRQAALEMIDIPNKEQLFERMKAASSAEALTMAAGGGTESVETASRGPRPRGRGSEIIKKLVR